MTKTNDADSFLRKPAFRWAIFAIGCVLGMIFTYMAWEARGGRPLHVASWLASAMLAAAVGVWTLVYFGSEKAEETPVGRLLAHLITTVGIGLVIAIVPILLDQAPRPTPPPDEFFHNHDLVVLTGYSLEQTLASASREPRFDPAVQSTLAAVKGNVSREFQDLSDAEVVRKEWPELVEENLIYFLGKDSPASLTTERWGAFLERADSRLAALPAAQRKELAEYVHGQFPDAIHEALKEDFAEHGKAWAGMEILMQKHNRDFAESAAPLASLNILHVAGENDRRAVRAGYGNIKENDPWLLAIKTWQSPHDYLLNIDGAGNVRIFDLHGELAKSNMRDGMLAWQVGPAPSETILVLSTKMELSDADVADLTNTIQGMLRNRSLEVIHAKEDGAQVAWDDGAWRIVADEKGMMGGPALNEKGWLTDVSHELARRNLTFTGRTVRVNPTKAASAGGA